MIDVLLMFINKIKKLIGTTNDTGGSSTAGTMMAKSNAILIKSDALNTAINTRAASSTALSTSIWTSTRASYLDYLASGSIIKSIQRGSLSLSNKQPETINFNTVNAAKSIILVDTPTDKSVQPLDFTNNSILLETWSSSLSCTWQLVEFN